MGPWAATRLLRLATPGAGTTCLPGGVAGWLCDAWMSVFYSDYVKQFKGPLCELSSFLKICVGSEARTVQKGSAVTYAQPMSGTLMESTSRIWVCWSSRCRINLGDWSWARGVPSGLVSTVQLCSISGSLSSTGASFACRLLDMPLDNRPGWRQVWKSCGGRGGLHRLLPCSSRLVAAIVCCHHQSSVPMHMFVSFCELMEVSSGLTRSCARTMTLDVAPPASLAQKLHIPLKTMTGPGPSNCSERVLQVTTRRSHGNPVPGPGPPYHRPSTPRVLQGQYTFFFLIFND